MHVLAQALLVRAYVVRAQDNLPQRARRKETGAASRRRLRQGLMSMRMTLTRTVYPLTRPFQIAAARS